MTLAIEQIPRPPFAKQNPPPPPFDKGGTGGLFATGRRSGADRRQAGGDFGKGG